MTSMGLRLFALVCILSVCALPIHAKTKNCTLNLKKDLRPGHPLILKADAPEFLYPSAAKLSIPVNATILRIACPAGFILVKSKQTNHSVAAVECTSKGKFHFAGDNETAVPFQIKDLKCSVGAQSISRLLPGNNSTSLTHAEIGLQLTVINGNVTETQFIAAIEETVSGVLPQSGLVRWSRTLVAPTILQREVLKIVPAYRKGEFFNDLDLDAAYVRANQRTKFLEIFNDTALVDKYLPETGDKYFVQGQLITADDLFYDAQQEAAYVYDNVLPVWQNINGPGGNWRLVDDLVRSHASISKEGIKVWSGGYQQLNLEDAAGNIKFITLTNGVEVPQFLYKYVHDPAANSGLVFVTLNNPHLERATIRDVICQKYSACDVLHPEFLDPARGMTYCCRLEDFRYQAILFGLPSFPDAKPLI